MASPASAPATVTIVDDDQAAVTLSTDATVVAEGSTAQFDVRLSHQVGASVTVRWTATSTDAGDYSPASGTVTFPANSSPGAVQSFSIDITEDDLSESTERLTVRLSGITLSPGERSVGESDVTLDTTPATAFIAASDAIVVSLSPPRDSNGNLLDPVVEGDSTGEYTVTLSKTPTVDLTVEYATADGTATAGSDYTAATGTITFSAASGETSKTITLATIEDDLAEGSESFTLTLSNPRGGGGPAPTLDAASRSLEVEIDDDDYARLSIQTIGWSGGGGRSRRIQSNPVERGERRRQRELVRQR